MIIWRGFGFIVLVVFLVVQFSTEGIFDAVLGTNYFNSHLWAQILATLSAALLVGLAGYLLNYQYREVYVDEETGQSYKSPSHSFFFIPVEFWMLIIPVIAFFHFSDAYKQREKDIAYLSSPMKDDKYLINHEIFSEGYKNKMKYGIGKVALVSSGNVAVQFANLVYDMKSGPEEDIKKHKVFREDYFSEQAAVFTTSELIKLRESTAIYQVHR
jgi:hypothetical protein